MENREAIERALELLPQTRDSEWITAVGQATAMYTDEAKEAFNMAIYALEKQKEDRWIPASERLPEDEYVLISKKPTKLSGSKWSVGIGIRMADPRSGKIQWRDSGFGVIQDDKVLAWRPLPEPFQEEK